MIGIGLSFPGIIRLNQKSGWWQRKQWFWAHEGKTGRRGLPTLVKSREDDGEAKYVEVDEETASLDDFLAMMEGEKQVEYGLEEFEKYNRGVGFGEDEEFDDVGPDHKCGYVALIGLPNVGKSTLLNSLIGQKLAIVTNKAQTTRQRVRGLLSEKDFQIILYDTPGIITRFKTRLDGKMMTSVRKTVDESDVVLMLVDAADDPKADVEMLQPPKNWNGPPMAVILNKMDLLSRQDRNELRDW